MHPVILRFRFGILYALLFLIGIPVLQSCTGALHNRNRVMDDKMIAEVLAVNDRMTRAALDGNTEVFAELISDDFHASDPNNVIRTREELLRLFAASEVDYRSVEMSIDHAQVLADDIVVLMGTESTVLNAVPDGSRWGAGVTLHRRFTNIFRREAGQWRMVMKQSTTFAVDEDPAPWDSTAVR